MDKSWRPRVTEPGYAGALVESYFLKLNDPARRWACWIKYTFLTRAGGQPPVGDCWFIFFDRERRSGRTVVGGKESFDFQNCRLPARSRPDSGGPPGGLGRLARLGRGREDSSAAAGGAEEEEIHIGDNLLSPGTARGRLEGGRFLWSLEFASRTRPLVLLPSPFYSALVPTSKLTTPLPDGTASGTIRVGGYTISCRDVQLSLGHNWGRRHSDSYVWAQAAATEGEEPFFFEGCGVPADYPTSCESPRRAPRLTVGKVRSGYRELAFNSPYSLAASTSRTGRDWWRFEMKNTSWLLRGEVTLRRGLVAGLRYVQPDGAIRSCLNSMMADAELSLLYRPTPRRVEPVRTVRVEGAAALEFLTPRLDHGITMVA